MIQSGRYNAAEKLNHVHRLWRGELKPEAHTECDRLGRLLLPKWQSYAKTYGTNAVRRHLSDKNLPTPDVKQAERAIDEFCRGQIPKRQKGKASARNPALDLYKIFEQGALRGLAYTEDEGEIPTVDVLRERALFYPATFLSGAKSAAALFVTYFLGRNDVAYMFDAQIPNVTLVDKDTVGLGMMRRIYPEHWEFVATDYGTFLHDALARRLRFDVVSCDPPMFLTEEVGWTEGARFLEICNNVFITTYSGEMMRQAGFGQRDEKEISTSLSDRLQHHVEIAGVFPRIPGKPHHWVVLRKLAN